MPPNLFRKEFSSRRPTLVYGQQNVIKVVKYVPASKLVAIQGKGPSATDCQAIGVEAGRSEDYNLMM